MPGERDHKTTQRALPIPDLLCKIQLMDKATTLSDVLCNAFDKDYSTLHRLPLILVS
jgi:hypothetical protein